MNKILQTKQNYLNKDKKSWNKYFYFVSQNMPTFARPTFVINLKLLLK